MRGGDDGTPHDDTRHLHSDETLARCLQAEEDEALAKALAESLAVVDGGASSGDAAPTLLARLRPGVSVVARHLTSSAQVEAAVPLARIRADVLDALAIESAFRALDGGGGGGGGGEEAAVLSVGEREHPTLALTAALAAWIKAGPAGFTWVDAPPCAACGGPTAPCGVTGATLPAEAAGLASRVELFRCRAGCSPTPTRFPRLNCPAALWHASHRRGRCGEWANAFGALLTAAGLDARHVCDVAGDHVWCEVWVGGREDEGGGGGALAGGRWVHVDPCEGALDTPLLYEAGWGKAPALVVAYGRQGVADVTRRYSAAGEAELAARRAAAGLEAGSGRLGAALAALSREVRAATGAGPPGPARLAADAAPRLPAVASPAAAAAARPGRTSGAAAWVASRSEGGPGPGRGPAAPAPPPAPPAPRYARLAVAAAAAAPASGSTRAPPARVPGGAVRLQAHPASRACGLHARASAPSPPGEGAGRAFDGADSTKWLAFHHRPDAWLEVRLGVAAAGGGVPGCAAGPPPPITLVAYTLAAGADAPGRDPAAWVVEGRRSGSGGGGWITLDARSPGPGAFGARGSALTFTIAAAPAPPAVDRVRLRIERVAGGRGADAVQLARWELWVEDGARAAFAAAVRAEFDVLVARGLAPNAAAVAALEAVTRKEGEGWGS